MEVADRHDGRWRVGCVSFLNARPLIEGLDEREGVEVVYDVPSGLLGDLEKGEVDVALCPVIDFQTSKRELTILPVGGIGCDGATLTVRVYSRVPIEEVRRVYVDTDSHTSINLMRVVLDEVYGVRPEIVNIPQGGIGEVEGDVETLLLIGDKVVVDAPDDEVFCHQLDLGEAWKDMTGEPFVFAIWMGGRGEDLGGIGGILDQARVENSERINEIVGKRAESVGWPVGLARQYLGEYLKFETGSRELAAIELFYDKVHGLGLIEERRGLDIYGGVEGVTVEGG